MPEERPYNPLDKVNLGKSVAEALLDRDDHPLDDLPTITGAGIYVIYYTGDFDLYAPMAEANADNLRWPIYIGKAVPSGSRRGTVVSEATGRYLYSRLSQHRESVRAADNLDPADFRVKYLIVDDIWIPLGESLLIGTFRPVWNAMLDGFGNHDPGSGRYNGLRPLWDVVHPGRGWAMKCRERPEDLRDIQFRVSEFLDANSPPEEGRMSFSN